MSRAVKIAVGALLTTILLSVSPQIEVKEGHPTDFRPKGNEYGESCSLHCGLAWKVTASSELRNHEAIKIDDGDARTAWIEGKSDYGVGESVTFHFTKELWESDESHPDVRGRDKVNFNGFSVLNGYTKSEPLWHANSRVKRLRVYRNTEAVFDISLADSMAVQLVECSTIWLHPNDTIKVEIMEVYPGDKYKDTAITELTPEGAH